MGMQALAVAFGASIQHAPEPIHGRVSQIQHTGHKLFNQIPSGTCCCVSTKVSPTCASLMRGPSLLMDHELASCVFSNINAAPSV